MGADIPGITFLGWWSRAAKTLPPLIERIEADIMSRHLVHSDGTPIWMLDHSRHNSGLGMATWQGWIWA